MSGWAVIPAIRVSDMHAALDFYQNKLGFSVDRGDPDSDNSALSRGDAKIMIEVATDFYSPEYNAAIEQRLGSTSPIALYIEAPDLDDLFLRLKESDVKIVDPLADRPWGQKEFTVEDHVGNWLTFWKAPDE
jgi:uncharacterized glyoxalase superfamily protein PhnB